jgi:hypothetical protein
MGSLHPWLSESFRRQLRTLRGLCQDIVELRRGDHSSARLQMEQERLEREREKTEEEVLAHFQQWAENPAVRDLIERDRISPEEKTRRIREIYGLPPELPATPAATICESSPVQPSQSESNQISREPGNEPPNQHGRSDCGPN